MAYDDQSQRFEALRHISKTFCQAYIIFLSGERIRSHIGSALLNVHHILWLICPSKQRDVGEILVGFQGRWTSIYYFLDSQFSDEVLDIFRRLSYRLTFNMLNVGMVDNLEFCWMLNELLNSEIQNMCSTPGFHADMAKPCYYISFFALIRGKEYHTLCATWNEINKFANYYNIIVRNSPAFDRHVFVSSQDLSSVDFDVMRMISTQIRWQDPYWWLCKLWEHRLDFI